jgi:hypothetical protein
MALDPFAGLQVFMENFWIWYNALTPLTFLLTFWPVILIDFVRSVVKSCFLLAHALYRKLRPVEYDPGYMPKISLIIPAHNEEAIIERAIESALETNYPNKEIIVVDDGSTDRTYQIALPYSKNGRIKLGHRDVASGSKAGAPELRAVLRLGGHHRHCGRRHIDREELPQEVGEAPRRPGVQRHIEKWSCNTENHVFEIEEAVAEKLYTYTLNEAKRDEVSKIFGFIEPVREAYVKCGYEAQTFQMVTGKSGISHLVDVYAKKGDENPVTSIARILTDKGIKPEEVLKHYAITLDVDVTTPVLIVSPQLDKESEVYTDQLKLEVIEGSNFKTIIEELEAIVCEQ